MSLAYLPPKVCAELHDGAERTMERLKVRVGADTGEPVLEHIWAIEDVLPLNGMAAVYGPPGSGKSLIILDMALHIASGTAWHGKAVVPAIVVYAALEGTKCSATGSGSRRKTSASTWRT